MDPAAIAATTTSPENDEHFFGGGQSTAPAQQLKPLTVVANGTLGMDLGASSPPPTIAHQEPASVSSPATPGVSAFPKSPMQQIADAAVFFQETEKCEFDAFHSSPPAPSPAAAPPARPKPSPTQKAVPHVADSAAFFGGSGSSEFDAFDPPPAAASSQVPTHDPQMSQPLSTPPAAAPCKASSSANVDASQFFGSSEPSEFDVILSEVPGSAPAPPPAPLPSGSQAVGTVAPQNLNRKPSVTSNAAPVMDTAAFFGDSGTSDFDVFAPTSSPPPAHAPPPAQSPPLPTMTQSATRSNSIPPSNAPLVADASAFFGDAQESDFDMLSPPPADMAPNLPPNPVPAHTPLPHDAGGPPVNTVIPKTPPLAQVSDPQVFFANSEPNIFDTLQGPPQNTAPPALAHTSVPQQNIPFAATAPTTSMQIPPTPPMSDPSAFAVNQQMPAAEFNPWPQQQQPGQPAYPHNSSPSFPLATPSNDVFKTPPHYPEPSVSTAVAPTFMATSVPGATPFFTPGPPNPFVSGVLPPGGPPASASLPVPESTNFPTFMPPAQFVEPNAGAPGPAPLPTLPSVPPMTPPLNPAPTVSPPHPAPAAFFGAAQPASQYNNLGAANGPPPGTAFFGAAPPADLTTPAVSHGMPPMPNGLPPMPNGLPSASAGGPPGDLTALISPPMPMGMPPPMHPSGVFRDIANPAGGHMEGNNLHHPQAGSFHNPGYPQHSAFPQHPTCPPTPPYGTLMSPQYVPSSHQPHSMTPGSMTPGSMTPGSMPPGSTPPSSYQSSHFSPPQSMPVPSPQATPPYIPGSHMPLAGSNIDPLGGPPRTPDQFPHGMPDHPPTVPAAMVSPGMNGLGPNQWPPQPHAFHPQPNATTHMAVPHTAPASYPSAFSGMRPDAQISSLPPMDNFGRFPALRSAPPPDLSMDQIRPACPLVHFGFGGKLLVMFPRRARPLNIMTSEPTGPMTLKMGQVDIHPLAELCQDDEYFRTLDALPTPLQPSTAKEDVDRFLQVNRDTAIEASPECQALRKLMQIAVDTGGELSDDNFSATLQFIRQQEATLPPEPLWVGRMVTPEQADGVLHQIQQLLMMGNRQRAVDEACSAGLWDQALLIATMVSKQAYQDVVEKYVSATLQVGSPLALLLSCFNERLDQIFITKEGEQQPRSERVFHHWLQCVGLLIANNVKGSNKALLQLGDRMLSDNHCIEGSHFCYLLAGLEPELAETEKTKMLLIGANHKTPKHRSEYVSADAIHLTMVYEYARQCSNPQFSMPSLCLYRYISAMLMAEAGLTNKAAQATSALLQMLSQKKELSAVTDMANRLQQRLTSAGIVITEKKSKGSFLPSLWPFKGSSSTQETKTKMSTPPTDPKSEPKDDKSKTKKAEAEVTPAKSSPTSGSPDEDKRGSWLPWIGKKKEKQIILPGAEDDQAFEYDPVTGRYKIIGEVQDPAEAEQERIRLAGPPKDFMLPKPASMPVMPGPPTLSTPLSKPGRYVDVFNTS